MKHAGTAFLVVMLFSTLGLWGLAQQKNGAYASRLRDLESRYSKIEDDQRSIGQQYDKSQRRITALEVEKADLIQAVEELKSVMVERDELKAQLVTRTRERDDLRTQVTERTQERDQVSSELRSISLDLQSLVGRVEAAIAVTPRPGSVAATPASRRQD